MALEFEGPFEIPQETKDAVVEYFRKCAERVNELNTPPLQLKLTKAVNSFMLDPNGLKVDREVMHKASEVIQKSAEEGNQDTHETCFNIAYALQGKATSAVLSLIRLRDERLPKGWTTDVNTMTTVLIATASMDLSFLQSSQLEVSVVEKEQTDRRITSLASFLDKLK